MPEESKKGKIAEESKKVETANPDKSEIAKASEKEEMPEDRSDIAEKTGQKVTNRGIWKRFFHLCKVADIPYMTLALYIFVTVLETTILIKIPQINADFFAGDTDARAITLFLAAELCTTFIVQIDLYCNHIFRYRTNRNLRNVLWGKILKVKPRYYDKVSASTLLSRITIDAESLNAFIMDIILGIVFAIYSLILTLFEMSTVSLKASVILLVFAPLSVVISFFMGRLTLKISNKTKFEMSNLTEYLSELLSSISVVKAFNRQEQEYKRGKGVSEDYYKAQRNAIGFDILSQAIGALVGSLPEIAIIIIGVRLLNDASLDAKGWYLFYMYSGSLLSLVTSMCGYWEQTKGIQGQLNMISCVLLEEEEGLDYYVNESIRSGDISFDHVSFSYDRTPVLADASFTIPRNRITALIGYSGAGKTTALKLLERIYEPDQGKILMSGQDFESMSIRGWRDKLAVVTQHAPMISGTIRENITYGIKREVTDEEIMAAAAMAHVDEFIRSCQDGLSHEVGQFGSKLSGGQKQKISIARAILAKPEYLILDEPTASLDIISTNEIAEVIRSLSGKMTVVFVAHQQQVIRVAEHIVLFDKDHRIIEGAWDGSMRSHSLVSELLKNEEV